MTFTNIRQIKAYKEVFPDAKPKCIDCHVDAIPKKDAGKHELNDYGKKVKETNTAPDVETYKKIGKRSDFKSDSDKDVK